jgi:hypothetical protein
MMMMHFYHSTYLQFARPSQVSGMTIRTVGTAGMSEIPFQIRPVLRAPTTSGNH